MRLALVRSSRRTSAALVLGLALVAVGTSGCNQAYDIRGPYSLGFDGEHVMVGVCTDMVIEKIVLERQYRHVRPFQDRVILEGEGELEVDGEAVVVGGATAGLTFSTAIAPEPQSNTWFWLSVNDVSKPELSATFIVPEEGVPRGKWLTPTGIIQDQPCE